MKYALFALGATVILYDMTANLGKTFTSDASFGFGFIGVGLIVGAIAVHGLID